MATSEDLARLEARAEQTDRILASLQAQIEHVKKIAVKQAGLGEEEKLIKENEQLRKEIESIKKELILAEIEHGVRQVQLPTKAALAALTSAVSLVNGKVEVAPSEKEPKEVKDASNKKTKQADQPVAGGKKPKVDKKENEGKTHGADETSKKASGDQKVDDSINVSRLDLRVGKIVSVERHPDADTQYVEQVDLGEGRYRTVISGLVNHFPISAMKDRIAVFMCNLKPIKIRGVLSEAMIMCAVGPQKCEILVPPTDSVVGDRVVVEEYPGKPDEQLNPKKKIWETLKPDVYTTSERIASYKGAHWTIPGKGVVVAPTLGNTQIS
ncbi:hypothetical protein BsWGS_17637 [Bradybaena similaris]